MKTLRLLIPLFLGLLLAGCSDPDDPITPQPGPDPIIDPVDPVLIFEADSLKVTGEGGTFTYLVQSTRTVSMSVSDDSWCKAILSTHTDSKSDIATEVYSLDLIVTIPEYKGREDREAVIRLTAEECEPDSLVVVQAGTRSSTNSLTAFALKSSVNSLNKDIAFAYDAETRTFSAMYLKWIDKDQPEMLVPEFTTDGESVWCNGGQVVSGETAISFADDLQLVVRAENGDEQTYNVSFNCPQINTELPVLRLQPASAITSKETYVKTKVDLYRPGSDEGKWTSADEQVDVRGRGNSTWGLPKKPYRLKFPSKVSPIGLNHAKAKSWVILAHDMDKSLLRNHLAFEISRLLFSAGDGYHNEGALSFTPCSQFVNVYMNDEYHGVYQMSDQMEVAKGRIDIDKLEASDGSDATKITGGYLVETNIHRDEGYPVSFTSSKGIYMDHKYPKDDDYDAAQYSYIEDFIEEAETVLYSSNFKDPDTGWRKYFDEKTLADFIITKEFAEDMDGYTSTYFYKRRGIDKIFFGPIWDCDKGWDNDKRNASRSPLTSLMINAGFYMPPSVNPDWFHRFWQDADFRAFVGKRWASKREELKSKVLSELENKPKEMHKAIEANFSVWEFYYQYSDEAKMPAKTYDLEIERMKQLTEQRATLLDKLFK